MNTDIYRFTLGDFQCIAISDGTHTYSPPRASRERLEPALHKHNLYPEQWAEWVSPYICLAVNTGNHQVLVDTGLPAVSLQARENACRTCRLPELRLRTLIPSSSRTDIRTTLVGIPIVKAD